MRMVGMVDKAFTCMLNRQFKKHGLELTTEQCSVLFCLWKNDGINQNEIAEQTYKDKTTISRHIHHLMDMGFVKRAILESDKRERLIFLTESGKELKSFAKEQVKKMESLVFLEFTEADMEVFRKGLRKALFNLTKYKNE